MFMTLQEFIERFDHPHAVVLLEGKRKVAESDEPRLTALGKLLASRTQHMKFRSGNAAGSDQLFSEGVALIDSGRLQVLTPYAGHRKKTNVAYETISLDDISIAAEPELIRQSKKNKKTERLIDPFVEGKRNNIINKAAYILRDTAKAIGTKTIPPATCGLFYDDLCNPLSGGTGHTMKTCQENNIPVFDQLTWFHWLEEHTA